ncbi:hypothetical protein [Microbacterium sp. NPDC056234]|uniref:hypothetical protein n=1 Tax=Microbacterium sp. NPDC056234 TaxID=3345757 RepID=UPI0035D96217
MTLLPFPDAVHVRAPGKINVYLGVGDRHDDGYHALATVFQAVSLYEDVIARQADDFSIIVKGAADPASVPLDDRNLAMGGGQHGARRPRAPGGGGGVIGERREGDGGGGVCLVG